MVKEVRMPQLATYELKPYFFLHSSSAGVIFSAPVGGATTPNSQNPRSELRQMSGDQNAAWSNKSQTWTMEAVMAFNQIPSSSDPTRGVVGMQIHDGNDDVTVLRLEKNGDLWVTKGDTAHHILVNPNYVLRTFMRVRVVAKRGGGISWYINNMTTPVATIPGVISGAYFKAGCYTQCTPSQGSGQGVTAFRSLRVTVS
jgi:hypothetical protein